MAKNENLIRRTAFATFDLPNTITAAISVKTDAFIPAGAIVTGIRFLLQSETAIESYKNATVTPRVGAIVIGHNNKKASVQLTLDVVISHALTADPIYVGTGDYVNISFGASGGCSDVTGVADVYVDYLYCGDKDLS